MTGAQWGVIVSWGYGKNKRYAFADGGRLYPARSTAERKLAAYEASKIADPKNWLPGAAFQIYEVYP